MLSHDFCGKEKLCEVIAMYDLHGSVYIINDDGSYDDNCINDD